MNDQTISTLSCRLDHLERQNRRLKRIGLFVLAATAALLLMGQTRPPSTVRTDRLDLVDASGNIRATLTTSYAPTAAQNGPDFSRGTPFLTFYDPDGRARATIEATPNSTARLLVYGPNANGTVSQVQAFDTGATVSLTGLTANEGAFLSAGQDGAGHVFLTDGSSNVVWQAP